MSEQKICPTCGTEYPLSERFCPRDGTALRSQNAQGDLVGTIIADRYHVLKKLGEGGMGQVYLAEHVKMGRKAALKVMNPGMNQDPDAIARFNREAANASRLNHPNICAIYDFGETTEGLIYLAMEFIEGTSLTSLIEKNGALPAPRAAAIIHQAADALGVAHDYGIVHRDLKPDNIMISKSRDGGDLAKVVDFGIAKASTSDAQKVTKTGLVVGTPEYMSPEQLAGDKLDGRSDIYSLGLVAFNCLTGALPFPSNSAQEAMIMRLTDAPKTLAEIRPDIAWPEELQRVMDKALARDTAERYQSAAEFGRDIAKAVENMPQAIAAAAGTQVIGAPAAGSLPPTRVAAGGATKKMEAAAAAAGAAATLAAPAKKSPVMMIAVGAVVVGIGIGAILMMRKGPAAATDAAQQPAGGAAQTTLPGSRAVSAATNPASPAPTAKHGTDVQKLNRPVTQGVPADRRASESGTQAAPKAGPDAAAVLSDWENRLGSANASVSSARSALEEIDALLPSLSGPTLGNAHYVRMMAYTTLRNDAKACEAARQAQKLLANPAKQRDVKAILDACQ